MSTSTLKKEPKNDLRPLAFDMKLTAVSAPFAPVRRTLGRGLHIELRRLATAPVFVLDLHRDTVRPSDSEVHVIIRDFELPLPRLDMYNGNHWVAVWREEWGKQVPPAGGPTAPAPEQTTLSMQNKNLPD